MRRTNVLLQLLIAVPALCAPRHQVSVSGLTVRLDGRGNITGAAVGPKKLERALAAGTTIEGCSLDGDVKVVRGKPEELRYSSRVQCGSQRTCSITQRFAPAGASVRWETEVKCAGEPWTAPIKTTLKWPVSEQSRFWTSWTHSDEQWEDPLEPRPFGDTSWLYGPYFNDVLTAGAQVGKTRTTRGRHFGRLFSIPLASILEKEHKTAITLAYSPDDLILDAKLVTGSDGTVSFERLQHRLGGNRTVKFAMDLVAHEADWRGGLRWMVNRYPSYFDPPNPRASAMAGTAGYSHWDGPIDAAKLKASSFGFLWQTCWDSPWFGLFYPPEETWFSVEMEGMRVQHNGAPIGRSRLRPMSYQMLNDRARRLRDGGFHYLAYFSPGEYCSLIQSVKPPEGEVQPEDLWKHPDELLRRELKDGIWRGKDGEPSYAGCEHSIVMDPADPNYSRFLMEQLQRCVRRNSEADGICVDRMWWASGAWAKLMKMEPINYGADDAVGWYDGRPGRHNSISWRHFLAGAGAIMHKAGKVVFTSPCMAYRLELQKDVDGFYDEAWPSVINRGFSSLNAVAFLAVRKPATLWTSNASWLKDDPDGFFQRHLYLGVYPSAPFPQNDHLVKSDPWVDAQFADYAPLMDAMRGKRWVLEPNSVEVAGGAAKANLFAVPGGHVAPIVFGGSAASVDVTVRGLPRISGNVRCELLHPGDKRPTPAPASISNGVLKVRVPLKRGCAMVRILAQ